MLHETIQRRVCRFAFLAGCVLPTLVVIGLATRVWLPGYKRQWETPLGQLFDCTVTVKAFRLPRPGFSQFERLVFSDPETDAIWATLFGVSHERRHGRDRVTIARAEFNCSTAAEFVDRVERLLRCATLQETELTIAEVALLQDDAASNLSQVRIQFTEREAGRSMQLWSGEDATGLRLSVDRNRQLDPPATLATLQTGVEPLPCWALAYWDQFHHLGPQARFQGQMEVIASPDSVHGKLSGRFSQLTFSSEFLLGEDAPTQLDVKDLCWNDGREGTLARSIQPGPVAALLAQLQPSVDQPLADERNNSPAQAGDVVWELCPRWSWPRAVNVASTRQHFVK